MLEQPNLKHLIGVIGVSEQLKKCKPLSTDYWIKENEVIEKLRKNQEKEKNMLKMSPERMQQRFDI